MICKSLLGDLTEQDDGIFRSYEATFIANSPENMEHFDHDANSERSQLTQNQQPLLDQVRSPLLIEKEKSRGIDQ